MRGAGHVVALVLVAVALLAVPQGPVGTAGAHCDSPATNHAIRHQLEQGGTERSTARAIDDGEIIELSDPEDPMRWFRIYVDEPGSAVVPQAWCVYDGLRAGLYDGDGSRLGYWEFQGSSEYAARLPVLNESGWYYLKVGYTDDHAEYEDDDHLNFTVATAEPDKIGRASCRERG